MADGREISDRAGAETAAAPAQDAAAVAEQRQALEAFVVDNLDLERLEALLDQFNIFEAIGVVKQELRHSDFLSFLLGPRQPHGLGDAFLKALMQKVLLAARGTEMPINLVDLDVWSLDDTTVLREWRNIDILVLNETNKIAVLIENKIGASEGPGQITRYYRAVQEQYPGWRVIALFLTPEGEPPSDDRFLAVSYKVIAELVEALVERRTSTLGPDVRDLMVHYAQMLRRHVVGESEIDELCRRIYQRHQRALDMIFERRPDRQSAIRDVLAELVESEPTLSKPKWVGKIWLQFRLAEWDALVPNTGPGEGHSLAFYFENQSDGLRVFLEIGPGGSPEVRQRLFAIAQAHQPPFRVGAKSATFKFRTIWQKHLLSKDAYDEADLSEITERIRTGWARFVREDLPAIASAISQGMKDSVA